MNHIQKLIQELCPDGVEWKTLGEVIDYEQPTKYIVESNKYDPKFGTPVLTAGKTFVLGYTNEKVGIFPASKQNPVIIFDDFTTSFHWVDFSFKVKSSAMKILKPKTIDSLRYMFYAMKCIHFVATEHSRHWIAKYSNFSIPLPPLEIQQEIVKILDKFTELEAELEAELEVRKKQYYYYRERLLDFANLETRGGGRQSNSLFASLAQRLHELCPDGVEWKTLGEVCEIKNGYTPSKSKSEYWENGTVNWFRMEDIRQNGRILRESIQKINPA